MTSNVLFSGIAILGLFALEAFFPRQVDFVAAMWGWALAVVHWEISTLITNRSLGDAGTPRAQRYFLWTGVKIVTCLATVTTIVLLQPVSPLYFAAGLMLTYSVLLCKYSCEFYRKILKST